MYARRDGPEQVRARLGEWPIAGGVPRQWLRTVNTPQTQKELEAMRRCVNRGRPMGEAGWVEQTAGKTGISLRGPGRPRKDS